jgi:peptidoglycan/LPS O-acetylase OafA/YrhL
MEEHSLDSPKLTRHTSLDGLRGLAVMLVFLYHHDLFQLGWAGVDLFFVISGFLITSILRQTRTENHFWKQFWIKRTTRILPPLIPLLIAAWILDHSIFRFLPAYLFSFGDVIAFSHSKFEDTRPLWSLAVEEHFYLVWPFAVRFLERRRLVMILLLVVIGEPLLRAFTIRLVPNWEFIYFLTPFRLDGICLGSLTALLMESETARNVLKRLSMIGMALVATTYVGLHKLMGAQFRRGQGPTYNALSYTLVALLAFFLISYIITHKHSVLTHSLSFRPLVYLGTISYGLYLYQNVCSSLILGLGLSFRSWTVASGVLTIIVASLSFHFYEKQLTLLGKQKARGLAGSKTMPL